MFTHYLTIAWRQLTRNRVYSLINILGLALGMAVVLLIGAWIYGELHFNLSFANHERIVAVYHHSLHRGMRDTREQGPAPLAQALRDQYPEDFRRVALQSFPDAHVLQVAGKEPVTSSGIYAEPALPAILALDMVEGRADLDDPAALLVSRSQAKALFGDVDPLNRMVRVDNKGELKVVGVYADIPENTDWRGRNYIMSWKYLAATQDWARKILNEWGANSFGILAELRPGVDVARLNVRVRGLMEGHGRTDKPEVLLQPMDRWHLYSEFKDGRNTGGAIRYVWMFGSIGVFVLLLACINFMNLATARSERRAREVGVRKSVGGVRGQLVLQFLGESVLMAFLSAVLAVLLAMAALPWFSGLAGSPLRLDLGWRFMPGFAAFTVLVGLLAGSYPALYLSSFNAVKVLKGVWRAGPGAAIPRKVLIVLQFTVSTSLVIGTLVVYRQIAFVKSRPVGYEREGLLTVRMNTDGLYKHYDAIRNELKRLDVVTDITQTTSTPTGRAWQQSGFSWAGKDPNVVPLFDVVFTTPEFGRTVGWQVVRGRDFSRAFATDSSAIVVNEAAAKYLGFAEPVGATVQYQWSPHPDNRYHIIGVVKDMVMRSPGETVRPAIYMLDTRNSDWILVKVNPAMSMARALSTIASVFRRYNAGAPFDFQFSSEEYARKFQLEERVLGLGGAFTAFGMIISCLGLFGLASFMAERRVREIGVRKVLGASVPQLWRLLTKEFVGLVVIAFCIAAPVAWVGMSRWLETYDYRTTVGVGVFGWTFLLAMAVTLGTVSWQAVRAAGRSPVRALRSE
jgi:predicted permease